MALETETNMVSGNTKFISIKDGSLCEVMSVEAYDALETKPAGFNIYNYETKDGEKKSKMIKRYKTATGKITKIDYKIKEPVPGKKFSEFQITMVDGDLTMIVALPWVSGQAKSFAKALPNMQLDKMVTFGVFKNDEGKTVLFFKHGEIKISAFFTRDNQNGMPDWEDMEDGTKDSKKQDLFLFGVLKNHAIKLGESRGDVLTIDKGVWVWSNPNEPTDDYTPENAIDTIVSKIDAQIAKKNTAQGMVEGPDGEWIDLTEPEEISSF